MPPSSPSAGSPQSCHLFLCFPGATVETWLAPLPAAGGGISLPWDPQPSPSCLCFTPPQTPSVTPQVLPQQAEQISCRQLLFPSASRSSSPAQPQTSALPLPPAPSKLKCWSPCPGSRAALREVEPCSWGSRTLSQHSELNVLPFSEKHLLTRAGIQVLSG